LKHAKVTAADIQHIVCLHELIPFDFRHEDINLSVEKSIDIDGTFLLLQRRHRQFMRRISVPLQSGRAGSERLSHSFSKAS
jgi:hypothetical protein